MSSNPSAFDLGLKKGLFLVVVVRGLVEFLSINGLLFSEVFLFVFMFCLRDGGNISISVG